MQDWFTQGLTQGMCVIGASASQISSMITTFGWTGPSQWPHVKVAPDYPHTSAAVIFEVKLLQDSKTSEGNEALVSFVKKRGLA